MPDIFISYSSKDLGFAADVEQHLKKEGLDVYLAAVSLIPGQRWTSEVLGKLKGSQWVLFLASREACASSYVQQELGAALISDKKIVPIIWDMPPSELPGWINQFQALNIAGATPESIRAEVTKIAEQIKADKRKGLLVVGALIWAFLVLAK